MAQVPTAANGTLNLTKWNFEKDGALPLNGQWEFYNSELLSPLDLKTKNTSEEEFIDFPSTWNDLNKTRNPGFGYATYRLTIILGKTKPLAIELPDMYSSYCLWANGKLFFKNGKVGTNANETVPQYLPSTVPLPQVKDTLELVLQIANFHHAKGGIREQIVIGDNELMSMRRNIAVYANIVMFCILVVIALFFSLLFLISKRQSSLLYFCALCITWGVRSIFSNQYIAIAYWPDFSWELAAKIEYITLFLVMVWAILLVSSLFRNDSNLIFKYLFCFCNGVFIALTLVFKASTYTQFLPVYLSFCAVLLLYIIYVLIRAMISDRAGALMMVLCTFMAVIVFAYDLISYQGFATYNPIIIRTGYVIMFLLMATALLYDVGLLKRTSKSGNVLTYEDLYGTTKTK